MKSCGYSEEVKDGHGERAASEENKDDYARRSTVKKGRSHRIGKKKTTSKDGKDHYGGGSTIKERQRSGEKLGKERSAKDIRGAATAESEKRKREVQKRKAQEEEEELEEDPDKPTRAEIKASKPASKALFIH